MKRWFISLVVTPTRVRKVIATAVSWFLQKCLRQRAWDVVAALPVWLRRIADFIDCWNAAELPADKDALVADLVKNALTDEAVDRLVDEITALECKGEEPSDGH